MHTNNTTDLEFLAGAGVDNSVALGQIALIDPDIGQLAVLPILQLEGQCYQGIVLFDAQENGCFFLLGVKRGILDIGRARKVRCDGVQ